jgi:hypothetical protein
VETPSQWNWILQFTPTYPQPGIREALGCVKCSPWNMECNHSQTFDSKALHGWWKYWRQQGTHFLQGEPSKIKDHDLQKIFDLYSGGISSGISFEMQNGLPSRMHQLSIAQGVSNIHPLLTNNGVPYSFQL